MSETINLTVSLDKKDYQSFSFHANGQLRSFGCIIIQALVGVSLAILTFKGTLTIFEAFKCDIDGFTVVYTTALIAVLVAYQFFYRWLNKPCRIYFSEQLIKEYTYQINANSIIASTNNSECKYNWNAIYKITQSKNAIYLKPNELSGYIIPKRQIENPEALYTQLQTWFDASRPFSSD